MRATTPERRGLFWCAAGVAAGALLVWSARGTSSVERSTPVVATPTIAGPATTSPAAAASYQQVAAIVAASNASAAQQVKGFVDDGWTMVNTAPPDPALLAASPTLLGKRETELRTQLASAPPDKKYLANVVVVATDAREPATRVAAVEAIARMGAGDPQHALVSIMKKLPSTDLARRALVPLLRPANTADSMMIAMAALLDDATVLPEEQQQIAMCLALTALHEGSGIPSDILDPLSPRARALLDNALVLARKLATAQPGT